MKKDTIIVISLETLKILVKIRDDCQFSNLDVTIKFLLDEYEKQKK